MNYCQEPSRREHPQRITHPYEYTNSAARRGSDPPQPTVIAIIGSTASGKTEAALEIAKKNNGEIILADSRQVYIGMNVGTNKIHVDAKIRKKESESTRTVQGIPYHGIDLVEPGETFTVQRWKKYAQEKVEEITARGKLPIIEGGTGLYVWALLDNLTIPKVPPDPKLRAKLEERIQHEGLETVAQEILEKDPDASAFLQFENPRRVIRALEIIEKTGIPFSQQRGQGPKLYNDIRIGIDRPLEELDMRIAERTKEQLHAGLEGEVRGLADNVGWEAPAMSGIGYIEWKEYFAGSIAKEEVLERIVRHTKQYARAQKTWFKRDKKIHWVATTQKAVQLAPVLLK